MTDQENTRNGIVIINHTNRPRYYRMTPGTGCPSAGFDYALQSNSDTGIVVRDVFTTGSSPYPLVND